MHRAFPVDSFIAASRPLAIVARRDRPHPRLLALQPATRHYADLADWPEQREMPTIVAVAEAVLDGEVDAGLMAEEMVEQHADRLRLIRPLGAALDTWVLFGHRPLDRGPCYGPRPRSPSVFATPAERLAQEDDRQAGAHQHEAPDGRAARDQPIGDRQQPHSDQAGLGQRSPGRIRQMDDAGPCDHRQRNQVQPDPSDIARRATLIQLSPAMPAAMKTPPQTGGVMVESRAYQNTNRWASKGGNPSSVNAGPATDTQIT
ncbi:hypothetical protein A8U91_04669 [Halomonas elongata]|uniref:Uncharacterized protein n=1 Tax=Halomonas elongata TaxID=2746 RepID=A0A1B8P005_HALEL|nr:hypothetical protein A8U91_04669 [Halomonas elongata]